MADDGGGILSTLGSFAKSATSKAQELFSKGMKEVEKKVAGQASTCDLASALEVRISLDVEEAVKNHDFSKAKLLLDSAEKVESMRKGLGCS